MIRSLCTSLLLLHCVHYTSTAALQRWTREAEEECIYPENSTVVCSPGTNPCLKLDTSISNNDYRIVPPSNSMFQLNMLYDVHAFRLCGKKLSSEVTLQEAEQCSSPTDRSLTSIEFQDCDDYFVPPNDELLDLEIYAFINDSCSLKYRFLIINTTSKLLYVADSG